MQHTTNHATTEAAQEWRVFAEGVRVFGRDRHDDALGAFAAAATKGVADYSFGLRLERSGSDDADRAIRVVGFWEESAFLRRITIERDLGCVEPALARELLAELGPEASLDARFSALEFDAGGEPVNLVVDVFATK